MAGKRRPPPTPPNLRRPQPTVDLPPKLVFVCEGATERCVLDGLRARWRIPHATVVVEGQRGDPMAVVDRCLEHRKEGAQVWAVFDRDEHERWTRAVQKAHDRRVELAPSNPCVELFGVLLHEDHSAPIDRFAAQHRLKQLHPKFDHKTHPYLDVELVAERWEHADVRARTLDRRAEAAGDGLGNPTTRLTAAIRALRDAQPAAATTRRGPVG
jgi:hypothetical protein